MINKDVAWQHSPGAIFIQSLNISGLHFFLGGTDTQIKASFSDDRKIEHKFSNSPMRRQEPLAGISYENPPPTPSAYRQMQPQPALAISLDNEQRAQEYQVQERVGVSISRPSTRTGLRPENLGHTLRHQGPPTPTTHTYQEVLPPIPSSLAEAPSHGSKKASPHKEFISGPFTGQQTAIELNHIEEELVQKIGGITDASSQPIASISRPPTSMGFQTGTLPGHSLEGEHLTPIRIENSKQESPSRERNVKLDSPYRPEITVPPTPTRSQSKQDSPGFMQRNLATPIFSRSTLPVVVEHQQSFKSSKRENPRTQVNAQVEVQVMNLQPQGIVEDPVVPIMKTTSKQDSPLLIGLRQVHATSRTPENGLAPEQITKSLSNVPFGSNTFPQVTATRYSPSTTMKQDPASLVNQPHIAISTLDPNANHRASLVGNASQWAPSHAEGISFLTSRIIYSHNPSQIQDRNCPKN